MSWFKNLNATPRLMSSFGILLALTLGISYLAISSLGKANARLESMYHFDLAGIIESDDITIDVVTMARQALHATVHAAEPAVVASDEKDEMGVGVDLRGSLDSAQKHFVSQKGIEALAMIEKTLPSFEQAQADVFRALRAKDTEGAKTAINNMSQIRGTLRKASDIARASKQERAAEEFQANVLAFESTRAWVLTASAISLAFGVMLSIVIARGFAVPLGQAVAVLEKVADGDLTATLDVYTRDEVGQMANALNRAVERLHTTLQEVADSAANASSSSQQLAAASEAIASGAQEQAAGLEQTSASLEQITSAVQSSADNARQASELASGAGGRHKDASSAVGAMEEISAASAKISDIISTVDEIAFQTNLLAVNAAVEAARAGDEGRGFAVVASEVRSLAQRSSVAAKEIKGLIQDSLRKVERGSELVVRVTQLVGQIALAAGEQSTGIEQVNLAMTQMDQVTQSNSAQTEELSATAASLSEQSARLLELVGTFTLSRNGKHRQDRQTNRTAQHAGFAPTQASANGSAGQPLNQSRRPGRGAGSYQGKSEANSRRFQPSAQPVPAASSANDASFEEF